VRRSLQRRVPLPCCRSAAWLGGCADRFPECRRSGRRCRVVRSTLGRDCRGNSCNLAIEQHHPCRDLAMAHCRGCKRNHCRRRLCRLSRDAQRGDGLQHCGRSTWLASLFAIPHSITSSARASTVAGISRPSAFAVLRLITSSYLVGACTGRSAGFSPLRMRST
jgi:hypothetical protein